MTAAARLKRVADGEEITLEATVSRIGRESDREVPIAANAVSRNHAEIRRTGHGYLIADLESRNGTFLNGERLGTDPHPLRDGDEIVIAGVETLRFIDPLATPMAPAIGRLTGVWIDSETRAVWVDAQPIEPPLSERQQTLIELLADNENTVVDRQTIIETVWADVAAEGVSAEAIDALVKRLKGRIRPLQLHGDYIEVHRGRGIRLVSE